MRTIIWIAAAVLFSVNTAFSEDLGNLSANPFDFESSSNPFGKGSRFAPNSINNTFGPYGSPFKPDSPNNPYGTGWRIEGR